MSLRGSLALTAAPVRRAPSPPLLWLASVEVWLMTYADSPRRREVLRAVRDRRNTLRMAVAPGEADRSARWIDALRAEVAALGVEGSAVALWAAVAVWDDAGGPWPVIARAVEGLADDADAEADRAVGREHYGEAAMATGREAMRLRDRMDEVEVGLWAEGG